LTVAFMAAVPPAQEPDASSRSTSVTALLPEVRFQSSLAPRVRAASVPSAFTSFTFDT
jgi:hypothetical protein